MDPLPTPPAASPTSRISDIISTLTLKLRNGKNWLRDHPRRKAIITTAGVAGVILIIIIVRAIFGGSSFFVPKTNYLSVYTLVNDKISQHGAIIINLPKGVSKAHADEKVTFEPAIKGEWVDSDLSNAVVFKATEELAVGKHYLVSLTTDDGVIKKDFLVDEDPRVLNVFPSEEAEAEPSSAITIVFNRPMVPITTLSELEGTDIPVDISPRTEGKFKWITTRTLQFIPKTSLAGSAHYTVTVKSDFVSMDGLAIEAKTYKFTTKELRLESATSETIVYNQPINFYFNQPIDLERTRSEITLSDDSSGRNIDFVAEYGKKSIYDPVKRGTRQVTDRSILSLLPRNSQYGRANVWSFESSYTASIKKVYPVGGDIVLSGGFRGAAAHTSVVTSGVIGEISVTSEKTQLASPALFDPEGSVSFTFYEDIDIGKSSIKVKGLKKIEYGEKCEESDENDRSSTCKKIEDRSKLIMTFNPRAYSRGEKIPVRFEDLTNSGGYKLSAEAIVVDLTVYPEPRIISTSANGSGVSVQEVVFCTNSPLKMQSGKEFYENVKANKYMVFGRWDYPYLQAANSYERQPPCAPGEYVNRIHYGLLPDQQYSLDLRLLDVFGQKVSGRISFTTGNAPRFYLRFQNLQKIYNVTTSERTRLTYATENFDHVDLFICKVSPDSMVRYLAAEPSEVSNKADSEFECISSVSDKIQLKPDQWVNQYFQIRIKDYFPDPRGQYILSFSHPQYRNEKGEQLYGRTYVSVTNLAAVEKRVKWTAYDSTPETPTRVDQNMRGSVYWITWMRSMEPAINASVKVFKAGGMNRWGGADTKVAPLFARSANTNGQGFAEFPLIEDVVGAAIVLGDESAIVTSWADTLSYSWQSATQEEKMYLYTDRPIYRPGQQVFIKGLYRMNFDGVFEIFRDADIKIEIQNSKGEKILSQRVPVSSYGTLSASVTIPADAPLGTYSITAGNGYAYFDVAEYVGAAFETKAGTDKEEYISKDTAQIDVSGRYYFGVPLDGGEVQYSFTSQDFYFDRYADEHFNFGRDWYSCYDCGYGDTFLKSGKLTLDSEGKATLSQSLDFDTLFTKEDRNQSKIVIFHGTIKDKQGKSVSFQKSFIVHRGDFYLGAKADPAFAGIDQPVSVRLKTVDTKGKPIEKGDIKLLVQRVEWESYKRQEVDGGFYNRSQRTLTPVIEKTAATDTAGNYAEEIKLPRAGEYEISAAAADGRGNSVMGTASVYIYGEGTVDVRPTNNATLDLKADKKDLKPGEKARFIIQSPFERAKALISIERGRIFSYEVVDIDRSIYRHEFPILDDYAPNIFASVVLLSPKPEIKFGNLEYTVDRTSKGLSINVTSNKVAYTPGEKVTLSIKTTDSLGRPVPANVSLSVADLSVLALKGNPKKDPLVFFYNGFPLTVSTESNVKNLLEEAEIPTGTKGGGGASPEDLATKKRGEFKDTAFWQADVITNGSGVAEVTFSLPDNLTRWQVESVGITKDTKVGASYAEILAQKEVMAVPLRPRFVVPGDEFFVGAKIFNQTKEPQSLGIALKSETLEVSDTSEKESIKAGETATVYFKVRAPENVLDGSHVFTISAENKNYSDTVEQSIPITRNETYESTATAHVTNETAAAEYLYLPGGIVKDRGGLTIRTSATLAVYLSDALRYLFQYPYGCSEQIASRLSAIALTKRSITVPNLGSTFALPPVTWEGESISVDKAVERGLSQIYESQTSDGGFAYYKGLDADPHLSIHVLNALVDLKAAGYSVRQNVIDRNIQYLYGQIPVIRREPNSTDTLIFLAEALSRADAGSGIYGSLLSEISSRADTKYVSDTASSNALAHLALISARGGVSKGFKDRIFAALENRVEIDSRGAYVKQNPKNVSWSYYETTEKDTALFLKAIALDKREYTETDEIIRWLVASRAKDGSWGSTNASVAAVDALSSYLLWQRETESHFSLEVSMDRDTLRTTTFDKRNILDSIETIVPINDIATDKLHGISFKKTNNNALPNNFYYDISLKYYLPVERIAPRDEGIAITRSLYKLTDTEKSEPIATAKVGDIVRGVITVITPKERRLFAIEDYIPAGFELVDFSLATEDKATIEGSLGERGSKSIVSTGGQGMSSVFQRLSAAVNVFGKNKTEDEVQESSIVYQTFEPDFNELHDDRLFLFSEDLAPGAYTYEYYLRATTPGEFSHLPAIASEMYFPENFGRTAGSSFVVER